MKKQIMLAILFSMSSILFAQQDGFRNNSKYDRGDMKERMLEKMKKNLDLTEAQVVKIKAIHEKYEDEEKAIHEEMKVIHEKRKAIHAKQKAEVDKILTAEQKAKINEMKAQREKRFKNTEKHFQKGENK